MADVRLFVNERLEVDREDQCRIGEGAEDHLMLVRSGRREQTDGRDQLVHEPLAPEPSECPVPLVDEDPPDHELGRRYREQCQRHEPSGEGARPEPDHARSTCASKL